MLSEQEKHYVVQSNPLIEAQYRLDLLPQKLIRYLISKIKPSRETFKKDLISLAASDFASLTNRGYDGTVYRDIKRASDVLLGTKIIVTTPDEVIHTHWIASYTEHKKEGRIEFEFSDKLTTELLNLSEKYTQYRLANVSRLKSQYSIRIYEQLREYVNVGVRQISLSDLRAILGIEPNEYKRFSHVRLKVLDVAKKEICAKTDIDYLYKCIKHVRKVVGIEFYDIKTKTMIPGNLLDIVPKKYRENKIVLAGIRKWIERIGVEYVVEKLHYVASKAGVKKYPEYLHQTLESNWGEGFVVAQGELPGISEVLIPTDTILEIDGTRYRVCNGTITIDNRVVPKTILQKWILDDKAKVVEVNTPTS